MNEPTFKSLCTIMVGDFRDPAYGNEKCRLEKWSDTVQISIFALVFFKAAFIRTVLVLCGRGHQGAFKMQER